MPEVWSGDGRGASGCWEAATSPMPAAVIDVLRVGRAADTAAATVENLSRTIKAKSPTKPRPRPLARQGIHDH